MKTKPLPTKSTYADTLEAAHALQAHFMEKGTANHSAYSKNFTILDGGNNYRMSITASSNIPMFVMNGAITPVATVYAALFQI
jgi:hypothetical protein